jgi:hypothetical protein
VQASGSSHHWSRIIVIAIAYFVSQIISHPTTFSFRFCRWNRQVRQIWVLHNLPQNRSNTRSNVSVSRSVAAWNGDGPIVEASVSPSFFAWRMHLGTTAGEHNANTANSIMSIAYCLVDACVDMVTLYSDIQLLVGYGARQPTAWWQFLQSRVHNRTADGRMVPVCSMCTSLDAWLEPRRTVQTRVRLPSGESKRAVLFR